MRVLDDEALGVRPAHSIPSRDIRMMLRIIAAIVTYEGQAYLPLLNRLKREYDATRQSDPSDYARQILNELAD